VHSEVVVASETVAADAAQEVALPGVGLFVFPELRSFAECLLAGLAGVKEVGVQQRVLAQVGLAGEAL